MASPRISFRCSAQDRALALKRAEREGDELSVAMRSLLADYGAGRMPSLQMARIFERLAGELRAIGVNLNQAARALNMGTFPDDLEDILRQMAKVVRKIRGRLVEYGVPRKP